MNKFKLLSIELIIALLLGILTSYLYISQSAFFENLNNKITDAFFLVRGEIKPSDNVVVVDIDEKSLKELGQWPWSRDVVATILQNLTKSEVGIVGLDIVFAEQILVKIDAPDYEEELTNTLANSPAIFEYIFDLQERHSRVWSKIYPLLYYKKLSRYRVSTASQRNYSQHKESSSKLILKLFLNTTPDDDGIAVRRVPMLVKYEVTTCQL